MNLPDHIQLHDPTIVPIEVALDKAWVALGLEPLGGASGKGWSRYRTIQTCPRKYYLRHVAKVRTDESKALAVGSAFHAFLAFYYTNMLLLMEGRQEVAPVGALRDLLYGSGANVEYIQEAWRLFDAYASYYENANDILDPLAVELLVVDPDTGNSCRLDLVASIAPEVAKERGLKAGTWIVEHKTARALSLANTEGWLLDGEVVGQVHLYRKCGLAETYGELQGVVVNITTKTKEPKFHREIVAPFDNLVEGQARALDYWDTQIRLCSATGYWPKALAACRTYGMCDYFTICQETQ